MQGVRVCVCVCASRKPNKRIIDCMEKDNIFQ